MFALPTRLWRLSQEFPRVAGVAFGLAVYLYVILSARAGGGILDLAAIVLPAVEFAMFAAFFAVYRDGVAPRVDGSRLVATIVLWLVLDGLATAVWVALARAAIASYAKLGVPPAFDLSI